VSLSPRLLAVGAALVVMSAAAAVHLQPHGAPLAGRPLFAAPAPPPRPAPLALPRSAPGGGPTTSWLPPMLSAPGGLWALLNRNTAATTRGQIGLLHTLEDTLRDQLRSLLERPLGSG